MILRQIPMLGCVFSGSVDAAHRVAGDVVRRGERRVRGDVFRHGGGMCAGSEIGTGLTCARPGNVRC